jgi:hypothetical protein
VPFDGAGADEEPGADVLVGEFLANQPDDMGLLGGSWPSIATLRVRAVPPGRLQFTGGALGECLRAHHGEHVVGGAQAVARINSSALAAQPLAVEQVAASQFPANPGAFEALDRLQVGAFRVWPAEQRPRPRLDAQRPSWCRWRVSWRQAL